ncbi:MAG: hypothetical protein Q8K02_14285 [Flavobacterium sp.]|nr:hypothetical protein [Flavobacterium sp.]
MNEEMYRTLAKQKMGMPLFLIRKVLEVVVTGLGGKFKVYQIPEINTLDKETLGLYQHTLSLCYHKDVIAAKGIAFASATLLYLFKLITKYRYYHLLAPNKAILVEESIIHWHLALHTLIRLGSFEISEGLKNDIGLFPSAVIFCYADEQTIKERIHLREKVNKINKNHLGKSQHDIATSVLEKQQMFSQYVTFALSLGVPVLQINTAESLEKNVKEIDLFLKNLK